MLRKSFPDSKTNKMAYAKLNGPRDTTFFVHLNVTNL